MANNFSGLAAMVYSGRGITLGNTAEGNPFVGYTLTGRSPSSQARELIGGPNTGIIRTELVEDKETLIEMFHIKTPEELAKLKADIAKGSRALIVYPAIMPVGNRIVVSNGAQTELLYNFARQSGEVPFLNPVLSGAQTELLHNTAIQVGKAPFPEPILRGAMRLPFFRYDEKDDKLIDITSYEPDAPNNTPRISGCADRNGRYAFHIVRKKGDESDIGFFWFDGKPGVCHTLTTYKGGNEKPLLSFDGKPLEGRVESLSASGIAASLYDAIGHPNPSDGNKIYRVAAAVVVMKPNGLETAIYNVADYARGGGPRVFFKEGK